jgi:hypothetical protein
MVRILRKSVCSGRDPIHFATFGSGYFVVHPEISEGGLRARIQGQSYISVAGNSAIYPGIGVTSDGTAAAAFTVAGPTTFASAAYASLNPFRAGPINIVAAGAAPQDEFSGYVVFGGAGVARWGDYSWGVTDGNSLWLATEYIPGGINSVDFFTDFGTYVYNVNRDWYPPQSGASAIRRPAFPSQSNCRAPIPPHW